MAKFVPQGLGWIPDLPDPRDYTRGHNEILRDRHPNNSGEIPDEVDLRYGDEGESFFTGVESQGLLNSSTAFAVLSLIEYFERREGRTFNGSKLFLYKVTRNLRSKKGNGGADTGADLRTTFKALIQFGVPPEDLWPYETFRVNEEPPTFVYQAAKPVVNFRYFRLLPPGLESQQAKKEEESTDFVSSCWNRVRSVLASGFPIAFGFSVPSSLTTDSRIPYRPEFDNYLGGMAALAIGYDSHRFGRNQGAILIRTSLGSEWGDDGNGWLPAAYFDGRIATDLWTIAFNQGPNVS